MHKGLKIYISRIDRKKTIDRTLITSARRMREEEKNLKR